MQAAHSGITQRNMSNNNVETVTSTLDRVKLALAMLVIVAGIVAFSVLADQPTVVRVGIFIGSLVVAAFIAWLSEPGRRTISFSRDSYNETKRVIWPTRKETTQMTGIVFAFVIVMGALLWLVDKVLGWVIYGLLLGWK
jgi:preprotein translocase subunit SecE